MYDMRVLVFPMLFCSCFFIFLLDFNIRPHAYITEQIRTTIDKNETTNISEPARLLTDKTATYEYLEPSINKSTQPDLFFSHQESPVILQNKKGSTKCVIISCSEKNYKLFKTSFEYNNSTRCDRVHFRVKTYSSDKKETKPHWCRLALLRQAHIIFRGYRKLLYVDVDVLYNEEEFLKLKPGKNEYGNLMISLKHEKRNTILRDNWFALYDIHAKKMRELIAMWAHAYTTAIPGFLDQEIFNYLFRCKDVTCVPRQDQSKVELAHCGSWLKPEKRAACFEGHKM